MERRHFDAEIGLGFFVLRCTLIITGGVSIARCRVICICIAIIQINPLYGRLISIKKLASMKSLKKLGWAQTAHYNDVTIDTIASQITSLTIVYSTVYSDANQRKHQSSTSLAFVRGIHRWPTPHKWPVTRKMFPYDDVIMRLWRTPAGQTTAALRLLFRFGYD